MGKDNKKDKKASWDGKSNSYDYLRDKFNSSYRPHSDRESSAVYNRKRQSDWERYMMTGEKASGHGRQIDRIRNKREDKSVEGQLFAAGIPRSQWQYYADKAGITNMNSKSDAEELIKVYNQDERYQGDGGSKKDKKDDDKDVKDFVPYAKGPFEWSEHHQGVMDRLSVQPPKLFKEQRDFLEPTDDQDEAARLFKRKYAADVTRGMNIREDRKLNLTNAMYSAPEFGAG